MPNWKDNIIFVLVEPSEWGNIGASARAIKNMGFSNLRLVKPPEEGKDEAKKFAHNADDVLGAASVFGTLKEAIKDVSVVIGTTRRKGRSRGVFYGPEGGIEKIPSLAKKNKAALVFGRERTGLTNEEIEECGSLISIPSDKRHPSLNLSHAVMVIAYVLSTTGIKKTKDDMLISKEEFEALYGRMPHILGLLGYMPEGGRGLERKILSGLRRFSERAGMTEWELKMLHGLCTRIERKLKAD